MTESGGTLPDPSSREPEDEGAREPEESRPKRARKRSFPGSELLAGRSSREILRRIFETDPLGLMPRIERRLRERAILIDESRVYSSAAARVAYEARRYEGDPPLGEWLDRCIDQAVRLLIGRDAEEERSGIPPGAPYDPHWVAMSQMLGIEMPLARRAVGVFHTLPLETRRAFRAIAVEGKSVNRWVAEGHGPPAKVLARIRYALSMMSTLGKHGLNGPDGATEEELDDE